MANRCQRVIFHGDDIFHDVKKNILIRRAQISEQLICSKKGQMDIRFDLSAVVENRFKKFAGRNIASQQIYSNISLPSQGSPHGQHKIRNGDRFCVQCAA